MLVPHLELLLESYPLMVLIEEHSIDVPKVRSNLKFH